MNNWRRQQGRLGTRFGYNPNSVSDMSAGFSKVIVFIVIAVLVLVGSVFVFKVRSDQQTSKIIVQPSDNYAVQDISLQDLISTGSIGLNTSQSLSINGQLRANNSLVIAPTSRPTQGTLGQIYYDQEGNVLAYYDGVKFVDLAGTDDVAELRAQIENVRASIPVVPAVSTLPDDIATQSGQNNFTGSNVFTGGLSANTLSLSGAAVLQGTLTVDGATTLDSVSATGLTVSGGATLGPTTASSLVLSSPLGVASGGTGINSLASNGVLIGQGTSPVGAVTAAGAGLCLISTVGAPVFQACPGGGGAVVDSLNSLTGNLAIQGNAQISVSAVSPNISLSVTADSIGDTQLAFDTGQNLTVSSTPQFNGVTLNNNLTLGGNSIVTSGATINSVELDVLDGGIAEGEVTGVITDVTAGTGLTGGAGSGNATLNVTSANGGIAVNADDIALVLQPTGDALSGTTSSGSGLEILTTGLSLLQGCGDGQILKWSEVSDTWGCAADAGGSGVGDDVAVNGLNADGGNFINTVVNGSTAGVTWNLNTTPSPDEITVTISNASATEAGVVTTGVQAFSGDKTYNNAVTVTGLFSANGGVTIETGDTLTFNGDAFTDLSGTGLVVAGGILQASLGTSVDSSEIDDLTITGADIANDTITDTQLAFNTGQNLTVSSAPSFAGITLTGDLNIGANNIVTSGATISSAELDVLDGGINEGEVTGVITDVTAGTGLTGGAASGNATVNIASANGGIVVNADDIALMLQPTGDALSATTSSGSGLEILGTGLSLLQGCGDSQILKWSEASDTWGCAADAGGSGVGDDITVNGLAATNANFIDTTASGSAAGVAWTLNTTPSPDDVSITISNASATEAGVVTTGIQSFAGDKTYNNAVTVTGLFTANGGVTIETGDTFTFNGDTFTDLSGTGLTVVGGVLQSSLGTSIDSSEIDDLAITGADIANDTIALGTKTTGDYAVGNTAGTGIAVSGTTGEGWSPTISLDYSSTLGSNSLGVNQSSFAATGVLFEGSTADAFETLFTLTDPTADNTITLPDGSGEVCIFELGNCAGSGTGVTTGGGSTNRLAKFTGSQVINDSTITDDGANVTTTVSMIIQGGNVTAGTSSQLGSFILADGNGQTTTLRAGNSVGDLTFILPTNAGNQYQCLKYDAAGQLIWDDCDGGGGGGGVSSLNGLSGALSIQGNSQIGVNASSPNISLSINADSIGDSQLVYNTGQHLTVTSTPTFASLIVTGDTTANRPGSPAEGQIFYDTSIDQLLVYGNGKWQADRSSSTKIVGSGGFTGCSGSVPVASANPDGADYVTNSCTSAQTAINSAISSLPANGGTVYLMEGTYIIDGPISVVSNLRIIGAGQGTIIKLKNGINADINAIENFSGTKTSVVVASLKLDGNKANNSSGNQRGIDGSSIGSTTAPGLTVRDVYIENFRNNGIYVVSGAKDVIVHNFITLNGAEGIHLNGNNNATVDGNEVRGSTAGGGIFTSGTGVTVSNNKVVGNTGYGINAGGARTAISGNTVDSNTVTGINMGSDNGTVTGNTVTGSGSNGIYLNTSTNYTTVANNTVSSSGANGIEVYNSSTDNIISGNTVADSGTSSASSSGIVLNANSDNTSVTNNRITDTAGTGYAISITGPANDTVNAYLADNTFSGTGASSINDQGTNTIYGGQVNSSANYLLQPTGTIELMKNTNITGNLGIGSNSIVTSGATISSVELDVLDGGLSEGEVTGVITDVTAGTGLSGGAASGNATLNITSANGGIVVNADDIALTLQPSANGLSGTVSSGSGLEILSGGLSLLQGCADGEVLKWNETTDTWGCAPDAGGAGLGDDISVNGANANNANFIDTVASGSEAGIAWTLNTTPSPDDISLTVSNASATVAGVVTTGAQAFAGDKTFNNAVTISGLLTVNANISIGSNSIVTSGATISSVELDVLDGGISEGEVTGVITDVSAGNGLTGGAASGNASVNVASANGGIVVSADSIALTLQPAGDALSATTSSGSGLEVLSGGLSLLQGCGDAQILKWNETSDTWGCGDDAGGAGLGDDISVNGTSATNANFINTTASGTIAGVTWSLNTTPSPDDISLTVSNASATVAGVVTTGTQTFAGDKTFNNTLTIQGNTVLGSDAADTLTVNAASTFNESITVAANKTLRLTGGATGTRPGSPSEGTIYFDTTTKQLLVYANGKWQTDRTDAVIVAASDSSQADKDAADYVADGNTVAALDGDQVQINAAITAGAGKKIVLLAGTYIADATITIPDNTTLSGVGKSTLIQLADIDATDNLIEDSGSTGQVIRDLAIDGNAAANSGGTQHGIYLNGVGSGSGIGAKIQNIIATTFENDAILLDNTDNTSITSSSFNIGTAAAPRAIETNSTSDNIVISDNNFTLSTAGSIYVNGTGHTISDNTIYSSSGSVGIQVLGARNSVTGNRVEGTNAGISLYSANNTVTGNNLYNNVNGIDVYFNYNTITSNIVYNSSTKAINLSAGDYNVISSNIVQDSGGATTNNGIFLDGVAIGNTISSNKIEDSSASSNNYAINISIATVDSTTLSGNTLGSGATINDNSGGDTVYGGQVNGSSNYVIQPAGTVELMKNTNVTGTLNVTGNVDTNGSLTVGSADQFVVSSLGVVTAGTWQGTVIVDTYVADTLTINSAGTVDWQALSNYPAACSAGSAISQLGDSVTCTAFAAASGASSYIQNQFASAQAADFWVNGNGRVNGNLTVGTTVFTDQIDTLTASGPLTIGDGAGSIILGSGGIHTITNGNLVVNATGIPLTLTGAGITGNRPGSPTEGMIYFDTDTDELLVYGNGKWQADRSDTVLVAASNSSQDDKDAADFVADGNTGAASDGDQVQINAALTAASGKKVALLAGTYTVDDAISIPNNTTLAGVGPGSLITIPNSLNVNFSAIVNTDATTGTNVTVQDLRLDGNKANQSTAIGMAGIDFNNMGGGSGSGARSGAKIRNIQSNNWYAGAVSACQVGAGICLRNSANSTITDTTTQGNATGGIMLVSSTNNTIGGNTAQGNDSMGIYLSSSTSNTITGNTLEGNTLNGIFLSSSTNNTVSGNTSRANAGSGFSLLSSSNNTFTGNSLSDNGGATSNSAISMTTSDSNTITGNTITDSSCTTTCHAINITNSSSDTNYLADNNLGGGTLNDVGTGTIYGGQVNGTGNYVVQPAGTIELLKDTNVTGTLTATTLTLTNDLTVANGGTGASTFTSNGVLYGNGTGAVGVTAAGTTGQCLLATTGSAPTWGTCTATSLQGTYNASSPATIDLSNSKDFTINATDQTTDSSIVFNLQCVTCSASGGRFAIQDAGVDIFTVNPNGDIVVGTASNNVTFVASNGYKQTASGTARNSKTIRLSAEYPSVVLDAGSGSLANTGTMTSKYDNTNRMSYYNWTTTQLTTQDYDIVVQVPLPKDFAAWDGNTPITASVWSSTTAANSIRLQLLDSANSAPTGYNFVDATPGSASTWTSFTPGTTISGTYTAGDYITLRIRMAAPTSGNIRVGNITLNYLSRF